jgi:hypothetical protein
MIGNIGYNEERIFTDLPDIIYGDNGISIKGQVFTVNLFDINSSIDIMEKLLDPALALYRRRLTSSFRELSIPPNT